MEQEDRTREVGEDQALTGFNISEAELISLQQAGGMVGTQDSAEHLSQGDLEALASIQEELDRMASGQSNIISEEIVMGGGAGLGGVLGESGEQVLVQAAFDPSGLELGSAEPQLVSPSLGQRQTVRVVKRPAGGGAQGGTKVRVAEAGAQQFRIVNSSQAFSLGGQQIKLVNAGNNLKTIAPSDTSFLSLKPLEPSSSMGNISIVNQDGSLTTLPVGGQGIRIVSASGPQAQVQVRPSVRAQQPIQPHPQQIRIVPSQAPQSFKILNADGSLSDISSSFIRPKSDLNPIASVSSSPKKKNVTYSSLAMKSPQKVITLKPPEGAGQIVRTADGRLISLQGAAKKVVLPATSSSSLQQTFSPTKILIRDSQGNTVQTLGGGARSVGQVLRLDQPSDKVQYVRVVNSSGKSQTVPLRAMTSEPVLTQGPRPSGVAMRPAANGYSGATSISGEALSSNLEDNIFSGNLPETIKQEAVEPVVSTKEKPRSVTNLEPQGVRPRKPCNCTKSQCLKLYCDCFANGQ